MSLRFLSRLRRQGSGRAGGWIVKTTFRRRHKHGTGYKFDKAERDLTMSESAQSSGPSAQLQPIGQRDLDMITLKLPRKLQTNAAGDSVAEVKAMGLVLGPVMVSKHGAVPVRGNSARGYRRRSLSRAAHHSRRDSWNRYERCRCCGFGGGLPEFCSPFAHRAGEQPGRARRRVVALAVGAGPRTASNDDIIHRIMLTLIGVSLLILFIVRSDLSLGKR